MLEKGYFADDDDDDDGGRPEKIKKNFTVN
jgi:hypothetical protein